MKRLLTTVFVVAWLCHTSAQTQLQTLFLWPIKDAHAGEGILYTPQSYIDGELNPAGLYIAAPEGAVVVAPCDGTIDQFCDNLTLELICVKTL